MSAQSQSERQYIPSFFTNSFTSRCPPLVTPDTTIIAVCGPNDFDDNAHPDKDGGWYISDFYLFHHLFRRGTAQKQYWMTCVDPRDLVRKYGEAVAVEQGESRSIDNRRVVLDEKVLAEGEVEDVLVFPPEDLLEKFLEVVAENCKAACEDARHAVDTQPPPRPQRPILILMFAHGRVGTFPMVIGGVGSYEDCPQLVESQLREVIYRHNPNTNIAFLTTSCSGGGWIQTPFSSLPAMTTMSVSASGSGAENPEMIMPPLRSWPQTECLNRLCGSRYASGVAQALIRSELQDLDEESESEIRQSATFAALVEKIRDILTKEVDARQSDCISFSDKDDIWDPKWRTRLKGYPLTTYRGKWEALRLISSEDSSDQLLSASSVRYSDFALLSIPEAMFRLKRLANDYLTSQPGNDSTAKNHYIHGRCHAVLRGATLSPDQIEQLPGALQYRLKTVIARATEYKNCPGLHQFPDCHKVNVDNLMKQMETTDEITKRHTAIRSMVFKAQLFDEPEDHESLPYVKGFTYLSLAFLHSGWTCAEIEAALAELVKFKQETSSLEVTMRAFRLGEVPELRSLVETLAQDQAQTHSFVG